MNISVRNEDEFGDISSRTWSRALESITKNGYKEGTSEGRDSAFQDSFDLGYEEGFKFGLHLGLHRALQRVHLQNHNDTLSSRQRINCQMCLDRDLLQRHVINVDNTQKEDNGRMLLELNKEIDNILSELGTDSNQMLTEHQNIPDSRQTTPK